MSESPRDDGRASLGEIWRAALSEVERIDVRERLAALPGSRPLSAMEIRHRIAMRGMLRLVERVERSSIILAELKRLAAAEAAAGAAEPET